MPRPKKNKSIEKLKGAVTDGLTDVLSEIYRDAKTRIPAQLDRFEVMAKTRFLEAQKKLLGKTMVILGPPAAGKTTLLRVLQKPEVTGSELESYRKTEIDAVKSFKCRWKLDAGGGEQVEFSFKVKKTSDIGGESYVRENHWGKVIEEVEILVYVFDVKTFLDDADGSYKTRIKEDFDWLLVNSQKPKVNFTLMLVANKADLYCNRLTYAAFEETHQKCLSKFVDELLSSWKAGLRSNIRGVTFLSLTDDILRHFTFDNLMLGFVGDDLRSLYEKSKSLGVE